MTIKKPYNQKKVGLILSSLMSLMMTSCAGRRYTAMDHRTYSKMDDASSSRFWRAVCTLTPDLKKNAIYKKWGGSGNIGGKPDDKMDEGFRRHDIVYYESRCGKHLIKADQELVNWLKEVDPDTLDSDGRKYRQTAIKFMSSPVSYVVGKPPLSMLRKKEREGCYFNSPEKVTAFFHPEHTGFLRPLPPNNKKKPTEERAPSLPLSPVVDKTDPSPPKSFLKVPRRKSNNGVLKPRG